MSTSLPVGASAPRIPVTFLSAISGPDFFGGAA